MRRIHVHKNTQPTEEGYGKRFGVAHLPVRQTLVWLGPIFVRIAPKAK